MSVDRKARVAERIRDVLARTIDRDLRDPQVGMVTLTAVRLSPDLRHATVFVSTLGDDAGRDASLAALDRVLAADPENADAIILSGYLLMETGRPEKALMRYQRALELGVAGVRVFDLQLAMPAMDNRATEL